MVCCEAKMLIGIPVFNGRVAPRLDCAAEMLIIKVDHGQLIDSSKISLDWHNPLLTLSRLKDIGLEVIICGAVPCFMARFLMLNGIQLISWVRGGWQEVLNDFLEGRINQRRIYPFSGPGWGRKRRWWRGDKI